MSEYCTYLYRDSKNSVPVGEGVTIFSSVKALKATLVKGNSGLKSPNFRFVNTEDEE